MPSTAPCGTFAAYRRHKRKDEPVDPECAQAARDQRKDRRDEQRAAEAAASAEAAEGISEDVSHLDLLMETRARLRGHLHSDLTPPQSVASIARELRAVSVEIASLTSESKPTQAQESGGVDDLARRRAERQANRGAVSTG